MAEGQPQTPETTEISAGQLPAEALPVVELDPSKAQIVHGAGEVALSGAAPQPGETGEDPRDDESVTGESFVSASPPRRFDRWSAPDGGLTDRLKERVTEGRAGAVVDGVKEGYEKFAAKAESYRQKNIEKERKAAQAIHEAVSKGYRTPEKQINEENAKLPPPSLTDSTSYQQGSIFHKVRRQVAEKARTAEQSEPEAVPAPKPEGLDPALYAEQQADIAEDLDAAKSELTRLRREIGYTGDGDKRKPKTGTTEQEEQAAALEEEIQESKIERQNLWQDQRRSKAHEASLKSKDSEESVAEKEAAWDQLRKKHTKKRPKYVAPEDRTDEENERIKNGITGEVTSAHRYNELRNGFPDAEYQKIKKEVDLMRKAGHKGQVDHLEAIISNHRKNMVTVAEFMLADAEAEGVDPEELQKTVQKDLALIDARTMQFELEYKPVEVLERAQGKVVEYARKISSLNPKIPSDMLVIAQPDNATYAQLVKTVQELRGVAQLRDGGDNGNDKLAAQAEDRYLQLRNQVWEQHKANKLPDAARVLTLFGLPVKTPEKPDPPTTKRGHLSAVPEPR